MYGKSSMSDWLVEILTSSYGKICMGKKPHSRDETAPSPGITGKQTFLL
jgi:hypothetical protein